MYSSLHHPHVTLFLVEQAVVMDQGVEPDLIADIQGLLEDLIKAGLRQRLIALIKVINYLTIRSCCFPCSFFESFG